MSPQPTITVDEFVKLGLLADVNRRVLHPLGLALSVKVDETGRATSFAAILVDDDPEGWKFGKDTDTYNKLCCADELRGFHSTARLAALGWIEQPTATTRPIAKVDPKRLQAHMRDTAS